MVRSGVDSHPAADVTISVFLADDQELIRAGFRLILEAAGDIEVVGEATNGRDAVMKARRLRPDVCLFDVRMPFVDGIAATRELAGPHVSDPLKVVIVTTFDLDDYVYGALEAGATGFLLKNAGPHLLIEAVRAAVVGDSLISPEITTRLLKHMASPTSRSGLATAELTDREEVVLAAVADGATNAEIAERAFISVSTVKTHLASMMAKIGARNRVELVIWAYQTGRVR
jgi:DNA-binding NarL/FixJ family response regulator